MKSSKNIRTRGHEYLVVAVIVAIILLVAAQNLFPQIKIGGLTIDRIKPPTAGSRQEPKGNTPTSGLKGTSDDPPSFINGMVYDITQTRQEVESYTPEGQIYLVSTQNSPWLLRAVSQKAREAYAIDKKFNDWRKANPGNKYDAELDVLAAAAAKKIPIYLPKAGNFALRDVAIERTMKAKLTNAATLKVLKIGVLHANWQIEKNSLGIPTNRYREAFIWAKNSADDHAYCHVYGFVVQQDYSGGGTYGATFAYQNTDVLFGCPAK